jgi:hypothetical protein
MSTRMRWAGHVTQMRGEKESMQDIGGKARRQETTRKAGMWMVDNIKMDLD